MHTQLNGLPQRNLIINASWLLQVCIVVLVGAGLVSCTKGQKAQGTIQPAQTIQPMSPCHPAGMSSSVTPEFCVNVTDIQLLNHETQAELRLSFINRTGRRLYVALIEPASLTDSSGRKGIWGTVQVLAAPILRCR